MENKETWITPVITVYGTVEEITKNSIPAKVFGGSDGAVWQDQNVDWAS